MCEKKIFLAYTYRALDLLYSHLYKMSAYLSIDDIVAHHEERQCCYAHSPNDATLRLQMHYRAYTTLLNTMPNSPNPGERTKSPPKLNAHQQQLITNLIVGVIPTFNTAYHAGVINVGIDKYNPIFLQYYPNLSNL